MSSVYNDKYDLARYGSGESVTWGSWHVIGILSHDDVSLVTVDVDNTSVIGGFNYDWQMDHVSLSIQTQELTETFWCQNLMKNEVASACLHHSPVGAKLCYITGAEKNGTICLTFHWQI